STLRDIAPVTVLADRVPLDSVLGIISRQTGLQFKRNGDFVAVSEMVPEKPGRAGSPLPQPPAAAVFTVSGTVTDSLGNPLPGVTVTVKGTNRAVTTGAGGY